MRLLIKFVIFSARPTSLTPDFRVEKMADMYAGKGFYCETIQELESALREALQVNFLLNFIASTLVFLNFAPNYLIQKNTNFFHQEQEKPSILNVRINPSPERKQQEFGWLKTPKN